MDPCAPIAISHPISDALPAMQLENALDAYHLIT